MLFLLARERTTTYVSLLNSVKHLRKESVNMLERERDRVREKGMFFPSLQNIIVVPISSSCDNFRSDLRLKSTRLRLSAVDKNLN